MKKILNIKNCSHLKMYGKSEPVTLEVAKHIVKISKDQTISMHNRLGLINDILGFSGVESLYPQLPNIDYCNKGDTYDTTVFTNSKTGKFYIGDWGSLIENM